jgi:hypothetical protein
MQTCVTRLKINFWIILEKDELKIRVIFFFFFVYAILRFSWWNPVMRMKLVGKSPRIRTCQQSEERSTGLSFTEASATFLEEKLPFLWTFLSTLLCFIVFYKEPDGHTSLDYLGKKVTTKHLCNQMDKKNLGNLPVYFKMRYYIQLT